MAQAAVVKCHPRYITKLKKQRQRVSTFMVHALLRLPILKREAPLLHDTLPPLTRFTGKDIDCDVLGYLTIGCYKADTPRVDFLSFQPTTLFELLLWLPRLVRHEASIANLPSNDFVVRFHEIALRISAHFNLPDGDLKDCDVNGYMNALWELYCIM